MLHSAALADADKNSRKPQMLSLLALSALSNAMQPRHIGTIQLKNAAVASLLPKFPGSDGPALLVTTFVAPFGKAPVYVMPSIGDVFKSGTTPQVNVSDNDGAWANEASYVPPGTLLNSSPDDIVFMEASGFFANTNDATGSIVLVDVTKFPETVEKTKISTDKSGFFYHEARWHDVDGDGVQDVLAARASKPILGKPSGEMVWIRQAGNDEWVEQTLFEGPDVGFALADLDGDGKVEIIASQFFTAPALTAYFCGASTWSGCAGGKSLTSVVIDDSEGAPWFNGAC